MKRLTPILILMTLTACNEKASTEQAENVSSTAPVVEETVSMPSHQPQSAPPPQSISTAPITNQPTADSKSFKSAKEAYNEGYYNGQQEGYTDATHHLDYGYSYDDDPEHSGFLRHYLQGYEDGYEDGYNEGLEWNSENE